MNGNALEICSPKQRGQIGWNGARFKDSSKVVTLGDKLVAVMRLFTIDSDSSCVLFVNPM